MFEVKGKYASAKIFTDAVDQKGISQVTDMLNQAFSEGETVRIMPDVHAGAGCTIGTTMTISGRVCPNLVGVDIGCGMHAVRIQEKEIDFPGLDRVIRKYVPGGFEIHGEPHPDASSAHLDDLHCADACDLGRAARSIGTLGGGNHFIEVDRASDRSLWLVIHTGSRNLGKQVAEFYQKEAVRSLHSVDMDAINAAIRELKAQGRQKEIQETIARMQPPYRSVPDALCWCKGDLFEKYIHDMRITQKFADMNRKAIAGAILKKMGLHPVDSFTTVHNYIDTEHMILRKGAVSAQKGERLLIPMNMRDGSLLCIGKGNPDWNCSAPHGAGRLMSRGEAKEKVSMEEYMDSMAGIWTSSVSEATIDESPMAYKPTEGIIENIRETADIADILLPVYNFKAG